MHNRSALIIEGFNSQVAGYRFKIISNRLQVLC